MNDDLSEIGRQLVEHASEGEFSARRGIVDELFPYIFKAAKRMSARAICRWLKDTQGIKISQVTVSKALQNPQKHWRRFFEDIEPAARIFSEAQGCDMAEWLLDETLFEILAGRPPTLASKGNEIPHEGFEEYDTATSELRTKWFSMDEDIAREGWAYLGLKAGRARSTKGKKL
jgi:hypothetical protein